MSKDRDTSVRDRLAAVQRHAAGVRPKLALTDVDRALEAAAGEAAAAPDVTAGDRTRWAVFQMSRDGIKVREIATALGISASYVVKLRAETGTGRVR